MKQLTKADFLPLSYTPTRSGQQRGQRAEVVSPLDENVKIAVPWLELLSSMAGHDWALILPLPTGEASMRPPNIKGRSVTIAGHKTSVSIENAFWKSLREIAEGRNETLYSLIGDIDAERKFANLSSTLRLFVLGFYNRWVTTPRHRRRMKWVERGGRRGGDCSGAVVCGLVRAEAEAAAQGASVRAGGVG